MTIHSAPMGKPSASVFNMFDSSRSSDSGLFFDWFDGTRRVVRNGPAISGAAARDAPDRPRRKPASPHALAGSAAQRGAVNAACYDEAVFSVSGLPVYGSNLASG